MKQFVKPTVVVSKCLEFAACRYNGDVIHDEMVDNLSTFVDFIPVCPEVEIGLGTPRDVIRIVSKEGEHRLIQPSTEKDLTEKMTAFANTFLEEIGEIDGFILKNRSPSCGTRDVKVYTGIEKAPVKEKGSGLFGGKVIENYGDKAVEEEGRLKNFTIREHFLTKLFTLAEFRSIKTRHDMQELIDFHSRNKYLFMAYNQTQLKNMGRTVANHEKKSIEEVFKSYELYLYKLLKRVPRYTSNINVCQHVFGYFKNELSSKEKAFFLEMMGKYKEKKIPLSSLISLLKAWAIRFENNYLLSQTYFEPYPEALVEISDSGKGRNYS
ncbi:YbgA family protein [Bacillus taeanensis]|uniref:DUF1722 domain-containing protein n=1 Tax=Bacillus taeanensis TaxID=273032 RepID=A0A366XYT7_9BACI|nr:DUF523 and DUF1722 domain-containing protein [Bacillus taeanensis]RBW69091.1 DUF1722 domain-containing protein [Bacillus taeanensis]